MTRAVPDDQLERAVIALVGGGVVGIPTDTVYGLAADPSRQGATEALFALKGRPRSLVLPVLVADAAQADEIAEGGLPSAARRLAEQFWPGGLTLVVPRRRALEWELGGDGSTIGLRCPDLPVARWLCEHVGPVAATSANLHGEPPLTTAQAVRARFGERIDLVLDGGPAAGRASTVVELQGEGIRCLREGAVAVAELEAALGVACE